MGGLLSNYLENWENWCVGGRSLQGGSDWPGVRV